MNPKVLVIATSKKSRGGITSVVKAHEQGEQWIAYNCKWIASHIDKGKLCALLYFFKGIISFLFYVPTAKIVHIHLSEPGSAMRKLFFFFLAKLFCKKTIVHFHSFSPDTTINGEKQWLYRYMFSKAHKVVVLSKMWKDAVCNVFNLDNVIVLYNPCATVVTEKLYTKQKTILYAGALSARKGYADLINAFAKIACKHNEWNLVFAGNGEIEDGKMLANELGIEKQCMFLGWISGEEKDKVFKESSIFCLPSYAEGFPMAVLDAWAYGLPVVTTPVGGIPDIVVDGENGLLFNPGDVDALAAKLEQLIKNADLRKTLSEEAKKLADTTFNAATIAQRLADIYEKI